jgi:hypothetical protein
LTLAAGSFFNRRRLVGHTVDLLSRHMGCLGCGPFIALQRWSAGERLLDEPSLPRGRDGEHRSWADTNATLDQTMFPITRG